MIVFFCPNTFSNGEKKQNIPIDNNQKDQINTLILHNIHNRGTFCPVVLQKRDKMTHQNIRPKCKEKKEEEKNRTIIPKGSLEMIYASAERY